MVDPELAPPVSAKAEVAGDEDLLFQGWVDSNHFAIWNESIERLFPLLMQGRGNNATYPKLYSDLLGRIHVHRFLALLRIRRVPHVVEIHQ